jgi:hypothetical protein
MSTFESEFLSHYLQFGLGAMPKTHIDALVMHLLDKHGPHGSGPLANLSNQTVSERLKTPVAKVKKLRYEAALKFGGRVEDQAQARLLAALANASLDIESDSIRLVIEDALAKSWLQGQLKIHQQVFDHSFNTEIVKVSASGLFQVLDGFFDAKQTAAFKAAYQEAKQEADADKRKEFFKTAARKFAEGAAKSAGGAVLAFAKAQLGL